MGEGRSRRKRIPELSVQDSMSQILGKDGRKDGGGCFTQVVFCFIREKKIIIIKNCSPICRPIIIDTVSAKGMESIGISVTASKHWTAQQVNNLTASSLS